MRYVPKKLPKDAVLSLRRVPVDLCGPYRVLATPLYVFLPKNQKFVPLKAPLHFFSAAEQEKYKPLENLYVPEFIDQVAPYTQAGETVRNLLALGQKSTVRTSQGPKMIPWVLAPFELGKAILQIVGPLWNEGPRIEPFFLCFFSDALCGPLNSQQLTEACDQGIDYIETSLLRASTAVFLALLLGHVDLGALKRLRDQVFHDRKVDPVTSSELDLLHRLVGLLVEDSNVREITAESLKPLAQAQPELAKLIAKLSGRLERIQLDCMKSGKSEYTLFGPRGICDG